MVVHRRNEADEPLLRRTPVFSISEPMTREFAEPTTIRKAVILTKFNLSVAWKKNRPSQVFWPLVLYLAILVGTRNLFHDQVLPGNNFPEYWESGTDCQRMPLVSESLAVACSKCETLANKTAYHLGIKHIKLFETRSALMYAMRNNPSLYYAGVTFSEESIGKGLKIDVTLPFDQLPMSGPSVSSSPLECRGTDQSGQFPCALREYLTGCFITVQLAAQRAAGDHLKRVVFRLFPSKDIFVSGLEFTGVLWLVPLYVSFLFVNLFNIVLVDVVTEKESKIRDILSVNGVSNRIYLIAWSVSGFVYGGISIIGIVGSLKYGGVYPETSLYITSIGCLLFFGAISSIAYVLSEFVETARSASFAGSVLDIVFIAMGTLAGRSSWWPIFGFVPSVPFFNLLYTIGGLEAHGNSATFADVFEPLLGLLLNALAFTSLAWYSGQRVDASRSILRHQTAGSQETVLASITHATKLYPGAESNALSDVSFEIKRNEVVVCLGVNAAGKSTLIRSLAGLQNLSAGSIRIDSNKETPVSLCPQEDALWDKISVRAHLLLYASLHGFYEFDINLVTELELLPTLDQDASTLSGGQKRRLMVALALQNKNADLFVFDEPSSGMDVEGRRSLWKVFLKLKNEHAVFVSTHYLDEAEIIGDKHLILSEGETAAFGSLEDLKSRTGSGFEITLDQVSDPSRLNAIISQYFGDHIKADYFVGSTSASFRISSNQQICPFIVALENELPSIQISIHEISLESLVLSIQKRDLIGPCLEFPKSRFSPSFLVKTMALARVRIVSQLSSYSGAFNQFVVPLIMVAISLMINRISLMLGQSPQLDGWSDINFSDSQRVTGKSLPILIPSVSNSSLQYPYVSQIVQNDTLRNFLTHSSDFPFAVDYDSVIWVNPHNTHITPAAVAALSSIEGLSVSSVPIVSIARKTFSPIFISFVVYFVITLVRVSIVSATITGEERFKGFQKFLRISGITDVQYWLGTLIGHAALNIPVVLGSLAVGWIGLSEQFGLPSAPLLLASTAVVNTIQLLIFAYLQSLFFTDKDFFLKWFPTMSLATAEIVAVTCVSMISTHGESEIVSYFHIAASLLVPQYPLCGAMAYTALFHSICTMEGIQVNVNVCSSDTGLFFTAAGIPFWLGLIQCIFLLLVFYRVHRKTIRSTVDHTRETRWMIGEQNVTTGQSAEEMRIISSSNQNAKDSILFYQLWHTYDHVKWAVKGLSVGCGKGSCLGVLSKNGGGKSTSIQALMGSIKPTAGFAALNPSQSLGYCPQSDFHWNSLSGYEHGIFFSRVKGINATEAIDALSFIGLDECLNSSKHVKDFSGGMRRRLALYVALLGQPDILVLDEPTSGVDLDGKRKIWSILHNCRKTSAILLTTHSMEEASHLCDKICVVHEGGVVSVDSQSEFRKMQGTQIDVFLNDHSFDIKESLEVSLATRLTELSAKLPAVSEPTEMTVNSAIHKTFIIHRSIRISLIVEKLLLLKSNNRVQSFALAPASLEEAFLDSVDSYRKSF